MKRSHWRRINNNYILDPGIYLRAPKKVIAKIKFAGVLLRPIQDPIAYHPDALAARDALLRFTPGRRP